MNEDIYKKLDDIKVELWGLMNTLDMESDLKVQRLQEEGNILVDKIVIDSGNDTNVCGFCNSMLNHSNTALDATGIFKLSYFNYKYCKSCYTSDLKYTSKVFTTRRGLVTQLECILHTLGAKKTIFDDLKKELTKSDKI